MIHLEWLEPRSLLSGTPSLEANLVLATSASPAVTGTPISFGVTALPAYDEPMPTGTVQFEVDGVDLGTPVTLADGTASSSIDSALAAGVHEVTAVYSGDVTYADNSQGLAQTIASPTSLTGATYTVNTLHDSGSPTGSGLSGDLRYAITMADANPGSRIIFAVTGTIHLASNLPDLSADVTLDGPGTADLTVDGSEASDEGSILDGVFNVDNGVTASISGLTITGGHEGLYGGGVANSGTLALTDCVLTGNTSSNGGGGLTNFGTLTITDCNISGNTGQEGGVRDDGPMTMSDCTISGNTGIFATIHSANSESVTTLTDCLISDNSGKYYAGVRNDNSSDGPSSIELKDCTITGNSTTATNSGGALCNNSGTMTVTGCTIADNSGGEDGGGISNGATMILADCTISGNTSQLAGGGIENSGTLTLTGSTVSGNSALYIDGGYEGGNARGGGGIYNDGTLTLTDSTISGNTSLDSGGGLLNDGTACARIPPSTGTRLPT